MAIRTVVTRGFGNGTFNGTIPLVTLRGYISRQIITTYSPLRFWPGAAPRINMEQDASQRIGMKRESGQRIQYEADARPVSQ